MVVDCPKDWQHLISITTTTTTTTTRFARSPPLPWCTRLWNWRLLKKKSDRHFSNYWIRRKDRPPRASMMMIINDGWWCDDMWVGGPWRQEEWWWWWWWCYSWQTLSIIIITITTTTPMAGVSHSLWWWMWFGPWDRQTSDWLIDGWKDQTCLLCTRWEIERSKGVGVLSPPPLPPYDPQENGYMYKAIWWWWWLIDSCV